MPKQTISHFSHLPLSNDGINSYQYRALEMRLMMISNSGGPS